MDLTVDLPDSRGNFRFVWPLHDPVALINTRPPIYTRHLWKIALFLTWRQNADHFSKLVYGTQKSITKGSTITIHAQVFGHCPNSFCTPPPPPPYSKGHSGPRIASILSATIDAIDQRGRGWDPPPYRQCPNAFCVNCNGASLIIRTYKRPVSWEIGTQILVL